MSALLARRFCLHLRQQARVYEGLTCSAVSATCRSGGKRGWSCGGVWLGCDAMTESG